MQGGSLVHERYLEFRRDLPQLCAKHGLDEVHLTFTDLTNIIAIWLSDRP